MAKINIILFEDGNESQLIEIEDDEGRSISIGERIREDNYTRIRITPDDIREVKGDW